jgi:hypothetical protein
MSDAVFDVTTDSTSSIVVELRGNAANVLVMDRHNFQSYRRGGRFRYAGGFYNRSPAVFRPGAGDWIGVGE